MEIFPVLKTYPAVGMTLIMTLIPLLFIGSFNLIVINLSEIQNSASIKGLVYTFEGIAFMVGAFVVKYISSKWRTTTDIFFSSQRWLQLLNLCCFLQKVQLLR